MSENNVNADAFLGFQISNENAIPSFGLKDITGKNYLYDTYIPITIKFIKPNKFNEITKNEYINNNLF
ncbi:UNVERIFIED_CONTAM: hypothetical protein O8I53_07420 [Campylobacter lari]